MGGLFRHPKFHSLVVPRAPATIYAVAGSHFWSIVRWLTPLIDLTSNPIFCFCNQLA
jgi:hypothetical protein